MTHSLAAIPLVLVFAWAAIGCDVDQPATDHDGILPMHQELPVVNQTKDEPEKLLRIDLDDPEAALATPFADVLSGVKKVGHLKQHMTVLIYLDDPRIEVSVATEGLTLSTLDDAFFVSIHGIPASLKDTARTGKEFCRFSKSPKDDGAAIDQ